MTWNKVFYHKISGNSYARSLLQSENTTLCFKVYSTIPNILHHLCLCDLWYEFTVIQFSCCPASYATLCILCVAMYKKWMRYNAPVIEVLHHLCFVIAVMLLVLSNSLLCQWYELYAIKFTCDTACSITSIVCQWYKSCANQFTNI